MNQYQKTFEKIKHLTKPEFTTDYWNTKCDLISKEFCKSLTKDFLQNPHIKETMVAANEMTATKQVGTVEKYWEEKAEELLSEPDTGGLKKPVMGRSCNIINHAYFATKLIRNSKGKILDGDLFLEVGGGFGTLGMVFNTILPDSCYLIVDVPAIIALQKCYLGDLAEVHESLDSLDINKPGINLVPIGCFENQNQYIDMAPDIFIAMWSIGEVTPEMNDWILSTDYPRFMVGTHNWKCGSFTQASRVYNYFKDKCIYTEAVGPKNHLMIK